MCVRVSWIGDFIFEAYSEAGKCIRVSIWLGGGGGGGGRILMRGAVKSFK